jgi:hypothetical protein
MMRFMWVIGMMALTGCSALFEPEQLGADVLEAPEAPVVVEAEPVIVPALDPIMIPPGCDMGDGIGGTGCSVMSFW